MDGDYLDTEEAAKVLKVSKRTLEGWRRAGGGPAWTRLSNAPNGLIRYTREAIDEWVSDRQREAQEAHEDAQRWGDGDE